MGGRGEEHTVRVAAGPVCLDGNLSLPEGARGIVLFAHGSGSSRLSPRNRQVAQLLNHASSRPCWSACLTPEEEVVDLQTAQLRFDIELLAERLVAVTDWLAARRTRGSSVSDISAPALAPRAALVAAAERPDWSAPSSRAAAVPIWPVRPHAGTCADATDRRRQRCPGHRTEPGGPRAAATAKSSS